jgi:hypothetical protein
MRGLVLLIGVVAALLASLLIVGAIELPQNVQSLLEPIPIKFILVEIGLVLILVMAMFVYWSFQLPRAARVALDLFRACLGFTATSIATPFGFLGLQNLSVAINQKTTINITWDTSLKPAFTIGIVALIVAYLSLREYREIRVYEYTHGLSSEL